MAWSEAWAEVRYAWCYNVPIGRLSRRANIIAFAMASAIPAALIVAAVLVVLI